jgi:hypothetical protein
LIKQFRFYCKRYASLRCCGSVRSKGNEIQEDPMKKQFAVRADFYGSHFSRTIIEQSQSPMNLHATDPDEQLKPISFTFEDRDLILSLYTLEPEIEKPFKLAAVKGNGVVVQLNAYDLDQLLGEIAAVANHEKNAKLRRRLDELFDRVGDKLEREFPK